jgi:IS30 family transposase
MQSHWPGDHNRRYAVVSSHTRGRLAEGWSPGQISGWLKSGAEPGLCALAMETIYAFIVIAHPG